MSETLRAAEELNPLLPSAVEITLSVVFLVTLAVCAFCLVQFVRGAWPAGRTVALILLALVLPVVGPILGLWLVHRADRRSPAQPAT